MTDHEALSSTAHTGQDLQALPDQRQTPPQDKHNAAAQVQTKPELESAASSTHTGAGLAELLFEDEYEAGFGRPRAGQRTVLYGETLKAYIVLRAPQCGTGGSRTAVQHARREFRRRWEQRASTLQVEVQLQLLTRDENEVNSNVQNERQGANIEQGVIGKNEPPPANSEKRRDGMRVVGDVESKPAEEPMHAPLSSGQCPTRVVMRRRTSIVPMPMPMPMDSAPPQPAPAPTESVLMRTATLSASDAAMTATRPAPVPLAQSGQSDADTGWDVAFALHIPLHATLSGTEPGHALPAGVRPSQKQGQALALIVTVQAPPMSSPWEASFDTLLGPSAAVAAAPEDTDNMRTDTTDASVPRQASMSFTGSAPLSMSRRQSLFDALTHSAPYDYATGGDASRSAATHVPSRGALPLHQPALQQQRYTLTRDIRALRPLVVSSQYTALRNMTCVSVNVRNCHPTDLLELTDVQLHLNSTQVLDGDVYGTGAGCGSAINVQGAPGRLQCANTSASSPGQGAIVGTGVGAGPGAHGGSGKGTGAGIEHVEFASFFRSSLLSHEPLPVRIRAGACHAIILRIVRVLARQWQDRGPGREFALPGGELSTTLTLSYKVSGTLLVTQHALRWRFIEANPRPGFVLSFKAAAVVSSKSTAVRLVVHNSFDEPRDVNLLVGPLPDTRVANANTADSRTGAQVDSDGRLETRNDTALSLLQFPSAEDDDEDDGTSNADDFSSVALQRMQVHSCQMLGLKAVVPLGIVAPHASTPASVNFLPLRRGRLEISSIVLHDRTHNLYFGMSEPFEVFVVPPRSVLPETAPKLQHELPAHPQAQAQLCTGTADANPGKRTESPVGVRAHEDDEKFEEHEQQEHVKAATPQDVAVKSAQ